ncbi:unnamed protein product [Urochloa decumbens]|uniref:non-specific serine/threonine protein kinase n=1 Tax=Urochloa decumbens TaxID=240449 RepID=A0ABC9B4M3_9POAL
MLLIHHHVSVWTAGITLLLAALSLSSRDVRGQLDDSGFLSIDCGYTTRPSYIDGNTGITYVADEGFTDAGFNQFVNIENMQPNLEQRYSTVRVFPNGTRNCYTLRSLKQGGKYLVRATFGYGNYDTLNRLPAFDLYLGVNYWTTVNITNASVAYVFDIITLATENYMQVCLVNIGSGTPFISEIDLRSLLEDLYPAVSAKQSLALHSFFRDTVSFGFNRYHFGNDYQLFRYPNDLYDRMWQKYEDVPTWTYIDDTIFGEVKSFPNDSYNAPSAVLRSVSVPANESRIMNLWWGSDSSMNVGFGSKFFLVLYFAEIQAIRQAAIRQFNVFLDNNIITDAFSPPKSMLATILSGTVQGSGRHNVSLVATPTSRLKPVISAMEIYLVRSLNESATNSVDANAMYMIQQVYSVSRNWEGDPCSPVSFSWNGLRCSASSSGLLTITDLNLSSSGLVGGIDDSFGQLASLQHLDLSNNNLSGPIPDFLNQMLSLTFLDLSSNNLSGIIPLGLLQKSQDGGLTLRIDNNPNLCGTTCYPAPSQNTNKLKLIVKIVVPIAGASAVVVLFVAVVVIQHRRKVIQGVARATEIFENRRFKYKELKLITNGFKNVIGKGGFGPVYMGCLQNGTSVAVKMRSQLSSQGNKEFLAEAQHLSKYMAGHNAPLIQPLTWLQRLTIALDSAYGLEYLHKSCSPPLIHRDVKTRNILLTANLRAKLSDFGLTRAFSSDTKTHITTQPAGTLGYLDPEYYATSCLSEKSDVYSFGVVALVLITARPAMAIDNEGSTNIVHWVRERLSEGDIESVTDPRIRGGFDVNSLWKAAELALHCTEHAGRDRPTMTEVVEGLRESLQLETMQRNSSIGASSSAAAGAESVSLLEAEHIGETLPR